MLQMLEFVGGVVIEGGVRAGADGSKWWGCEEQIGRFRGLTVDGRSEGERGY